MLQAALGRDWPRASIRATQRHRLNGAQVDAIVRAGISERKIAAREYEQAGHADRAAQLRSQAQVLMVVVLGQA